MKMWGQLAVVQLLSHVLFFVASGTAACQAPLSFSISWSLLKFMPIESVMLSNHLILCRSFSFCLKSFLTSVSGLLAVQGTLKSLLQHHNSKASLFWHSVFFMVQLSHLYMNTGKTIPLTIQTFVGKVMSLLFNMLSRFVIAFLSRNKRLLISWLQSPSAVIHLVTMQ